VKREGQKSINLENFAPMKKKIFILFLGMLFISTEIISQETKKWSLKECIEYARENNLSIKQQSLNAEYESNQHQQKKMDRLPNLNGNTGYQISFGRVPDETTYEFLNRTTQFGRFSVGASMPLFQGFTKQNAIKQQEATWLATKNDLKAAKNDLALNITAFYLQVLFDKELLEVAHEQHKVALEQVENTSKLVEAGRVAEGYLLEIKSQVAREALNVTQMNNNLTLSLLSLAQTLDLENPDSFDIVTPELNALQKQSMEAPDSLFKTAVNIMPQIEASEFNLKSSIYAFKAAKGQLYPSVSMDAGWNTSVSKSRNGPPFNFGDSFKNNANEYIGISLRIPIFNGLIARNNIKNARLNIRSAENELEQEKQLLRKEIQQAFADAEAAFQKYQAAKTAVDSYVESLRYTEKKYSVGLVSPVDYSVARTDYMIAQSDLLQSKYEFLLRTRILDFYQGESLSLN
jgi:outer membrane protein